MTEDMTNDWTALAFMGDAVYEVYVREHVIGRGRARPKDMHEDCVRFVNARAQAAALKAMLGELSEGERETVRKARNHKPGSVPSSAGRMEYQWATAFEALIGKLYLEGDHERLEQIAGRAVEITEGHER